MTSTTIIKPDIKAMTVPELKEFCIRKSIPVKGLRLRAQLEKAIEAHTLTPIKITSAEADRLLQKQDSEIQDSEIQDKWNDWRDCLQYDAGRNCTTQAQILAHHREDYIGQICSVASPTSSVGVVLDAADGQKLFCTYPDQFKLVTGFSKCEYWECKNQHGEWVEFTHVDSEPSPHRVRQISRSEYDRRTPQRHNVMPSDVPTDNNGSGDGNSKPPAISGNGESDSDSDDSDEEIARKIEELSGGRVTFVPASKWQVLPMKESAPSDSEKLPSMINCNPSAKEHPILFGESMVRAILDGKKTQTRRLMKPQPKLATDPADIDPEGCWSWYSKNYSFVWGYQEDYPQDMEILCPLGQVGSRLWVREAFAELNADFYPDKGGSDYTYRADHKDPQGDGPPKIKWTPSLNMPRKASRLTLEITDVRVERLQDIGEEDAIAEGFKNREEFALLWDSIYPKNDWQSNPWVWVISFSKAIDADCPTCSGVGEDDDGNNCPDCEGDGFQILGE